MVSEGMIMDASRRIGNGSGALFRPRGTHSWALYPEKGGWHLETVGFVGWFPRIGVWFDCPREGGPCIRLAFYKDDGAVVARMSWGASQLSGIDFLEPGPDGRYSEEGKEATE